FGFMRGVTGWWTFWHKLGLGSRGCAVSRWWLFSSFVDWLPGCQVARLPKAARKRCDSRDAAGNLATGQPGNQRPRDPQPRDRETALAFGIDLPHTTSRTFRATISVRLLRRAFQRM